MISEWSHEYDLPWKLISQRTWATVPSRLSPPGSGSSERKVVPPSGSAAAPGAPPARGAAARAKPTRIAIRLMVRPRDGPRRSIVAGGGAAGRPCPVAPRVALQIRVAGVLVGEGRLAQLDQPHLPDRAGRVRVARRLEEDQRRRQGVPADLPGAGDGFVARAVVQTLEG